MCGECAMDDMPYVDLVSLDRGDSRLVSDLLTPKLARTG